MGMVFQQPALFDSLTIYENWRLVCANINRISTKSKLPLESKSACLSFTYTGIESKKPQEISYGMQKRVSLVRTVAVNPRILLFDEPNDRLRSRVTTNKINHLILELSRKLKTTSLVVSHDMQCALDIADHILVLDKGEIVTEARPIN